MYIAAVNNKQKFSENFFEKLIDLYITLYDSDLPSPEISGVRIITSSNLLHIY